MENLNIKNYQHLDTSLHIAAQVLAFLGQKLGNRRPDHSHTTLRYDARLHALIGQSLNIHGNIFEAHLYFNGFYLDLISEERNFRFSVEGKSVASILSKISKELRLPQVQQYKMPYRLPKHYNLEKFHLYKPAKDDLSEWGQVRFFAHQILKFVNTIVKPASVVYIWPHHFDSSTYHVLRRNPQGELAILNCGFAMRDQIVKEPYFYCRGWQKESNITYNNTPELNGGEWKTGKWQGAVLPLSTCLEAENKEEFVKDFFSKTTAFFIEQLKK